MLLNIIILVNLLLYSCIASQPLFYWLVLGRATRQMSGATYTETRQLIDRHVQSAFRIIYYGCLASSSLLAALTAWSSGSILFAMVFLSWMALLGDVLLSVYGNVPINRIINGWDREKLPEDWKRVRLNWSRVYRLRQVLAISGYLGLLMALLLIH